MTTPRRPAELPSTRLRRVEPGLVLLALVFVVGLLAAALWPAPATIAAPPGAGGTSPPATVASRHGPWRGGSAVYPAQDIPLRFDHGKHLALGQSCESCHAAAPGSDRVEDRLLPRGEACDGCHGDAHPATESTDASTCATCHVGAEGRRIPRLPDLPAANLRFSHARHTERGADCSTCHGDMRKVRLATTLQLPSEETCLTCHGAPVDRATPDTVDAAPRASARVASVARDDCALCHPTRGDGRLRTARTDRRLGPALVPTTGTPWGIAHDLAFVEDHRGVAKARPDLCASCHDDASCLECHAGNVRPMRIHAGDFLSTHGLDARGMANDCQACHRLQSDCIACHERLGLSQTTGSGGFGGAGGFSFHPAGFRDGVGVEGHAFAAQRNLGACASCHDEDTCLACHATTRVAQPGLGVSPHGPGFADSLRCERLAEANRRVCLRCHAPGEPALACLP